MTGTPDDLPADPRLGAIALALDADDLRRYREHGCPSDLGPWLRWLSERKRDEEAIRTLPAEIGLPANWNRVFRLLYERLDLLEILPGLRSPMCGDAVSLLPSVLACADQYASPGLDRERYVFDLLTYLECWRYRITCRRTGARLDLLKQPFRAFLARHPVADLEVEIAPPDEPVCSAQRVFSWVSRELARGGKG